MANQEINDLTAKTTPVSTDEVEIQETAGGTSKKATLGNVATAVGNLLMPVGFIYVSGVSTNPNTLLGFGTWTQIEGKFIAGVSTTDGDFDLDDTGGAKTHDHSLTAAYAKAWVSSSSGRIYFKEEASVTSWDSTAATPNGTPYTTTTAITDGTELGGNTDSGDSLPPFIAKYIWQRTA